MTKILEIGAHIGGIWAEYKPTAVHVSLDLEYTRPLIPIEKEMDLALNQLRPGNASKTAGELAKKYNELFAKLHNRTAPALVQGNGTKLPFNSRAFDEIHTRNVAQHLPIEGKNSVEELALEMARVANEKIIVSCFRPADTIKKSGAKMDATKEKIITVLKSNGFKVDVFEGRKFHKEFRKTYPENAANEDLHQYQNPFLIKATKIKIKPKK